MRSFRPGRGADGCRATAVSGAFGRAYFPAMAAPTTVPRSIDRRHHRQRRRRGRRRREASSSSRVVSVSLDYCAFPLLRGHPLILSLAITRRTIYCCLLSDDMLFNDLYRYNCLTSFARIRIISKLSFQPRFFLFFLNAICLSSFKIFFVFFNHGGNES